MNRSGLVKLLANKTNLSLKQAEKLVIEFGKVIEESLAKGDKIVYSNFGTFYKVHYPSKVIFHPKLGAKKKMVMLPTDAVKWMPSGIVKDLVAQEKAHEENVIQYGSSKKIAQKNKEDGIVIKKSEEIIETDYSSKNEIDDEEEVTIPIKTIRKKEPIKTEQKEEKSGSNFWDELFKKASNQDSDNKNSAILSSTPKEDQTKKNESDNGKVTLAGAGIFGNVDNKQPAPSAIEEKPKKESEDQVIKDTPVKEVQPEEENKEPDLPLFTNYKSQISYIDLSKITVPREILGLIPEKVAREYKVAPVEVNDNQLTVAMIDPEDLETIELIKKITQKRIIPKLTTESDVNHVLDQYQGFESEVEDAIEQVTDETEEQHKETKEALEASASDTAPAARIADSLLKRAIRDKASDIHIEPSESEVIVRFRIDGVLHKKVTLPKDIQLALVSRIKIISNLKIDEQRLPQDGRFSIKVDSRRIDFRVSTMPIANGEKVVMRVLDKLSGIKSIDQLGFRERDFKLINSNCEKSHGMLLVTGPTGSGKTTTLYALIDKIYSEGINIITLEDPIEYQMPGINQSQVNSEIDYTFASGLRSILRQDPDVVMIGEIRDKETSEMAVHAALTGHVVLSTLHTNDSAGALPRLIDMGIEPFLLNSSLNLVIGQRLARKVCDSCKKEVKISESEMKDIKAEIDKMPETAKKEISKKKLTFFKGEGCKSCSETGYTGRIGLYEVLEVTNEIRAMASKNISSTEIRDHAVKDGMTTMIQDGILKAMNGLTTIEEVWRVTKE